MGFSNLFTGDWLFSRMCEENGLFKFQIHSFLNLVFFFSLFIFSCSVALNLSDFPPFCVSSDSVLWGPGAAVGAGDHGTGAARERAGHLSPGCDALPFGLFPGQDSRSVPKLNLKVTVGTKVKHLIHTEIYTNEHNFCSIGFFRNCWTALWEM